MIRSFTVRYTFSGRFPFAPRLLPALLTLSLVLVAPLALAQNVEELLKQGNAAQSAGNYPQAEAIWRQVIQRDPQSASAYYNLGDALYNQGKLDEAIAAYQKALQLRPNHAETYIALGNALDDHKQPSEAIAAYQKAIQLQPNNANAYRELGIALYRQKKIDEAIAAYRKAIELDPKSDAAYRNLGNALYTQKKLDQAVAAFSKAIEVNPKSAVAYYNLGTVLSDQRKLDDAITAYRKAIALNPKYALPYTGLGNALYDQNKMDEAIAAFRKAIELNPNSAITYHNLGIALSQQDQLDEAIAAYNKAIELAPKYATAYDNLGNALAAQNKLDEAVAAYKKAISLNPNMANPYNGLGSVLRKQNNLEEAEAAYRKAIELDAKFASAYYNLGILLALRNRSTEAVTVLQKSIALYGQTDSSSRAANISNSYVWLGNALLRQNKPGEAIAAYRSAIESDPQSAWAQNRLGDALYSQKKFDQAMAAYRKSLSLPEAPGIPTTAHTAAHNSLGLVLQRTDLEAAIQEFTKALAIDPNYRFAQTNLKEAQRLLNLKTNPAVDDDTKNVPTEAEEPKIRVLRATALIRTKVLEGTAVGSGWVIARDGNTIWIVTNRHVIMDPKNNRPSNQIEVSFYSNLPDERRPRHRATREKWTELGEAMDLAVLRVANAPADIQPLQVRSGRIGRSTRVWAVGHPQNTGIFWNVAPGEVTAFSEQEVFIPISAVISEGDSGGPVVNEQNQVVAMVFGFRGEKDIAFTGAMQGINVRGLAPATGRVGLAYRVDKVMEKLVAWKIVKR